MADNSLVADFRAKCKRAEGIVNTSIDALAEQYSRKLVRDAAKVQELKLDVARLASALRTLDDDIQPQLERLAKTDPQYAVVPPRPPRVTLIKEPTHAEHLAAALAQKAWRRRRSRTMTGLYCPVSLRRNFTSGVVTPVNSRIAAPAKAVVRQKTTSALVHTPPVALPVVGRPVPGDWRGPGQSDSDICVNEDRHFMSIL